MRFAVSLLAAAVWGAVGCQPPAEDTTAAEGVAVDDDAMSDADVMLEQIGQFEDAFDRGDAAAMAGFFSDDSDHVDPTGVRSHGRDAIQARYVELFDGPYHGTSIEVTRDSVRFLSADTAVVFGSFEITGMTNTDGDAMSVKGDYMNLSVKENGQWMIHCNRPMIPIEAPSAD